MLSLQLFQVVFNSSITVMRSSWCAADDCSFLSLGFYTFLSMFMSECSGSHCSMMPERPRQFNLFTPHVTADKSAPFVPTTVDIPHPNHFTYTFSNFSPSEAATSFMNMFIAGNRQLNFFDGSVYASLWFWLCFSFLTHAVHHDWNGLRVDECSSSSISDGSRGAGIALRSHIPVKRGSLATVQPLIGNWIFKQLVEHTSQQA